MNIFMKLVYQYMAIFFNFSPNLNHLLPLVGEDGNGNLGLKGLTLVLLHLFIYIQFQACFSFKHVLDQ